MRAFPLLIAAVSLIVARSASATIIMSARVWNGSSWGSQLGTDGNAVPRIQFAVFLSFTNEGADLRAARYNVFAGESRTLTTVDRTIDITSAGLGRQAPYNTGANPLATFFRPTGFRIDEATDSANSPDVGILNMQPFPPIDSSHSILLYRFDFIPSPSLTGVGVVVSPNEAIAVFDLPGGGFSPPLAPDIIETATVIFVPAPATTALLAAVGFHALWRRRSR